MEKYNFLSIVICFVRNISLLTYLLTFYPWFYLLNLQTLVVNLLMFSVVLSKYSLIYSQKYALYLSKF